MSRRWLLSLLCLSAAVVFVRLSAAQEGLRVNESATRFLIQAQAMVLLEVRNPTAENLAAHLKLELLDPEDSIRGLTVRDITLRPGANKLSIPLRFTGSGLTKHDNKMLPWYRIRYRIEPAPEAKSDLDAAHGVISLSEIDTPDIFAIEVSAPRETHRGGRHSTHVRAFHPITTKPVKDVNVSVELKLDDDSPEKAVRGSGITDAAGYALVTLNIPARISADEGELKVVARHGGYIKETSNDIELNENVQIMITTDKPIYQPGQPLHVRALVFNSAKHAASNAEATLKITDPENTTVFQTTLLTSRFGVANADWIIPENTRLGDYSIFVEMDDEDHGDSNGYHSVKISRYDLPNFAVNAKPNRPYYLPHQSAEVEVRADYLFGQPVRRGHVRVIREEKREWNFREQKWDIKGGDHYEGETDDAGRFVALIDLTPDHHNLAEEAYSRFVDLTYAAYFTDATTNRTEQRRFDLRVTKDAIHTYIAEGRYRQAQGFPLQFYLVTSFADGTPAPCEVEISESPDDEDKLRTTARVLRTIRTNKYGIAKVVGLSLPEAERRNASLNFRARNSSGDTGHHTESFYFREVPVIRVETDKALYRPGDPIRLSITASEREMNMIVAVSREASVIESQALSLHDGAAAVTLRYRPEFQDEVTISAYSKAPEHSDRYDLPFGSRTVLFPRDRDLKLNVRLDQAVYKPGEEATVDFHVSTPDGRSANSTLGIVIFDRAVEERARTDQDFRGGFGFSGSFREWRRYDDQVGGITRQDLQRIDLTKPQTEEMELVAELLLGASSGRPEYFEAEEFEQDPHQVFAGLIGLHLKPIGDLLDTQYQNGALYPANGETLRRLLFEARMDFDQLRDPWGTTYREAFSIEQDNSVLAVVSAGPDKVFSTKDDFSITRIARPYFRFTGEAISRAVQRFHARTGGFIRDAATLKSELESEGIDFDSLRDPWGQQYYLRFTVNQNVFNVTVCSGGPNRRFEDADSKSDDFALWIVGVDYMVETRARMDKALGVYFNLTKSLPCDDGQLERAFASATIEPARLRDAWGRRYYAVYKTESRYADRNFIQSLATYGQQSKERLLITPVTEQVSSIRLRSGGEDGKEGTADDFDVARFSQLTGEEYSGVEITTEPLRQVFFSGAKGAIKGTVRDQSGGAITGARLKATMENSKQEFETETDDEGRFLLRNLPVGFYELRCDVTNFKSAIVTEVPVSSSNITSIDFTLSAGNISETVTVTAGAEVDQTSSASATSVTEGRMRVSISQPIQLTTPRLREYFPETLLWQPSLESDRQGRAQLKFKLADNITTWKMSVIGSTEDGEIGTAETEIKAFQPFFVEHDPPRILTEGDQISLPLVLRNYLERAQTVDLEIKPESWFALQGIARQRASVPAGDSVRTTFDLKAVASVKDGKQRVTARGLGASDAIEKPVTVHPDGEEKTQTSSDLLSDSATLDLDLPASLIPGSVHAELKIYPSLMAHVVESIEGILERPHGCGEQTISSTYPSLLLLRRDKQLATDSRISTKARRYLQLGYQRLLNYRTQDGGFSYWGRGEPDLALTAYALRFLSDAREFVPVDDEVVKAAREWLIKQQNVDGSWPAYDHHTQEPGIKPRTALLTAFVARVLAMSNSSLKPESAVAARPKPVNPVSTGLDRALSYLAAKIEAIDEPYLIASYALAAIEAGDKQGATRATARLRSLADNEGDTTYWSLETNTPFYGWGRAGRVETTALAVQALARLAKTQPEPVTNDSTDRLVRSGLLFLLRNKDRYGVWYSTQATINVLDTLVTLLTPEAAGDRRTAANAPPIEVIFNGQLATSVSTPSDDQSAGLILTDVSAYLRNGTNRVELRRPAGSPFASVQLVSNYYVTWATSLAGESPGQKTGDARSMRLAATFDKNTARINEEIVCHVKAERLGFGGYGMMLAEIGLPPGSDVDRASLENAMRTSSWAITQYDVLPDRVVVYLWPATGAIDFDFKFRPRFALTAKAAPSVVYDYYNPEARAVVAPVTFVVK